MGVVDKKQKPSKKRRSNKDREDEAVKPRKKFATRDRQDAQDEIEEGYDKWRYGEEY